jgi:hypothetical protein
LPLAVCLCAVATTLAQQSTAAGPVAAWHISAVAKLDQVSADAPAAAAGAGELKYLRVKLAFDGPAAQRKLHKFRVVDRRGEEAGELSAWYEGQSLLIFEGKWDSWSRSRWPWQRPATSEPSCRPAPPSSPGRRSR